MPFQSEKQRRYLWANEPEIARDWADTYGSRIEKNDGGIMRTGFFTAGLAAGDNISPGTTTGSKARDRSQKDDMSIRDYRPPPGSHHQDIHGPVDKVEIKKGSKKISHIESNEEKRNLVLAMRKLGLMGGWNPLNKEVPEWAQNLTEEELMTIATSGPYLSQQKSKWDASKFGQGKELLGRVFEGGPFNTGNVNTGGGGDQPLWMQLGYPSHAAWAAAQGQGDVTEVAEVIEEDVPSNFQPVSMAQLPFPNYPFQAANGGRIPAAFGGIMDSSTGRRAYGFGSIFKSIKKAAGKVLKSDVGKMALMYGAATGLGSFMPGGTGTGLGRFAPSNLGALLPAGLKDKMFMKHLGKDSLGKSLGYKGLDWGKAAIWGAGLLPWLMPDPEEDKDEAFDYMGAKNKYADEIMRIKAAARAGTLDPNKFNYLGVKDGGRIGLSNGGDPLLVDEYDKYVFEMEEMGLQPMSFEEFKAQARAGMYAGGQSIPSDYTMEDAMMTTTQDKLGGITDVMKQADLNRQGSVGQFYAADGGRIGYGSGTAHPDPNRVVPEGDLATNLQNYFSNKFAGREHVQPLLGGQTRQDVRGMGNLIPNQGGTHFTSLQSPDYKLQQAFAMYKAGGGDLEFNEWKARQQAAQGGRIGAEEGGLMDLGGMEKDYRNDGGFVPIGGEEKADDVPARLSRNEFVFTADAVRGAGGGDIDKGAEIMENVMKNLEEGGQISEETQGLSGAQEMFGVSERLSEVV